MRHPTWTMLPASALATLGRVAKKGAPSIYLVRHAFAGHADPTRWPDDSARPLTPDGISRFREAARGLRRLAPEVKLVLSSRYARAWETAELLHEVTGWPEPRECTPLEAEQPASGALDVLREHQERPVALVGHEPYLSRLASLLCVGAEETLRLQLKKGGVVAIDMEGEVKPETARLLWAVGPKILRPLGDA